MITFNRYVNQEDHVWYDSSNIVYSKCYDTQASLNKTVKIVFKGGRTYVYRDVDANDYLLFKQSESSGQGFNKWIKKYNAVRIADTDIDSLTKLRESFIEEINENDETKLGDLYYKLKFNEKTGEFTIELGDKVLFKGIEGQFSILNLLASLNIKYVMEEVEDFPDTSDENLDEIKI